MEQTTGKKPLTAVEWLVNQMKQRESQGLTLSMYELEMFGEQAKEMEKNQIIEARFTAPVLPSVDKSAYLKEAEGYYNKTFKPE